jgi:hypothetical protein
MENEWLITVKLLLIIIHRVNIKGSEIKERIITVIIDICCSRTELNFRLRFTLSSFDYQVRSEKKEVKMKKREKSVL